MDRLTMVVSGAFATTTLLALTPLVTQWQTEAPGELKILEPRGGRVEVAIDDQDLGVIESGDPLEVCFVVRNTARERLLLRQTTVDPRGSLRPSFPTYGVSPGQKVAITAQLQAAELEPRGVTHVLFETSDPKCPRLWLTVRGTVIDP